MSAPPKKLRHARIEKSEPHPIGDEMGHLWAVSYADLLMVLLSFFIIFFSVDASKRDSVFQRIALATGEAKEIRNVASALTGGTGGAPVDMNSLFSQINDAKLSVHQNGETLRIEFPDNVFKKGKTDLPDFEKRRLAEVVKALMPFANQVEIVFIGHSDPAPVRRAKSKNLKDNYDLSAIRANSALRLAATLGLDPKGMRTSGAAQHDRPSRTLTIEVVQRSDGPR